MANNNCTGDDSANLTSADGQDSMSEQETSIPQDSPRLKVLILDDLGNRQYPDPKTLPSHDIEIREDFNQIRDSLDRGYPPFANHYDIIFLDSNFGTWQEKVQYGWREFAVKLREKYRNAFIYLVSSFGASKLSEEFQVSQSLSDAKFFEYEIQKTLDLEDLINTDPRVLFVAKPKDSEEIRQMVENIIAKHEDEAKNRIILINYLCDTAVQAYKQLMEKEIKCLLKEQFHPNKLGDPPHGFDMIVEDAIKTVFLDLIQSHQLVLATEEEGVQNVLFRKVKEPRFYLFSDPLDGSSKFGEFLSKSLPEFLYSLKENSGHRSNSQLEALAEKVNYDVDEKSWKWSNATLLEAVKALGQKDIQDIWKYGPIGINAPTISMSLAVEDKVFASVLVNVFTGRAVCSTDKGNQSFSLRNNGTVGHIREALDAQEVVFRDSDDLASSHHCLAQLKAVELLDKGSASRSYEHFTQSVRDYLVDVGFNIDESILLRHIRRDFSPGPGRILFMTNIFEHYRPAVSPAFKAEGRLAEKILEVFGNDGAHPLNERYGMIFANGEPVTEWIHWFAFLHNARGSHPLKAYRLSKPNRIRWKDDSKSYMAPPEVSSMFKHGHMDLRTLFSSYHEKMHRYTDTVLICEANTGQNLEKFIFYDDFSRAVTEDMAKIIKKIFLKLYDKDSDIYKIACRVIEEKEKAARTGQPEYSIYTEKDDSLSGPLKVLFKEFHPSLSRVEEISHRVLIEAYMSLRKLASARLRPLFTPIRYPLRLKAPLLPSMPCTRNTTPRATSLRASRPTTSSSSKTIKAYCAKTSPS